MIKKQKSQNKKKLKLLLWLFILMIFLVPLPFIYNSCGEAGNLQYAYILHSLEGDYLVRVNQGKAHTSKKEVTLNLEIFPKKEEEKDMKYEMFISDTSDCSEGEWEPYVSEKKWPLKLQSEIEEKEYVISVKFREARKETTNYIYKDKEAREKQAETACFSENIFYDNQPPQVAMTSFPSKKSNLSSSEFTFSTKDGSGYQTECKLNDEDWEECSSSWNRSHLEEGEYTFSVKARDLAGNISEIKSYSWTIDFTSPSINWIQKPLDPNKDTSSQIGFRISGGNFTDLSYYFGTDKNGEPNISLRRRHLAGQRDFDFNFSTSEGQNYFKVKGTDAFGNSNSAQFSWFVDRAPPQIEFINSPPLYIFDSSQISFQVSATDNHEVRDIRYRVDGGNVSYCSLQPFGLHGKKCKLSFQKGSINRGSHTFYFFVRDRVGNEPRLPLEHTLNVTFTPVPKTQFVKVLAPTSFNSTVDILFVVDDSGSMNKHQTNLANGFTGFINGLQNIDWRIAFTTTTTDKYFRGLSKGPDGLFVPVAGESGKYFLTSSSPPLLAVQGTQTHFEDTIKSVGTRGSYIEKGITALDRALRRYKSCQTSTNAECGDLQKSRPNKEFFRSNSTLAVVFISDSNALGYRTPTELIKDLKNTYFTSGKKFLFHSILGNDDGPQIYNIDQVSCNAADAVAGSSKYLALSKSNEGGQIGKVMNIKKTPYTSCLETFGASIRNLAVTGLQLNCLPVDGNADGQVDEPVISRNSNPNAADTAPYTLFTQARTRAAGSTGLSFTNPLPAGSYKITYFCAP